MKITASRGHCLCARSGKRLNPFFSFAKFYLNIDGYLFSITMVTNNKSVITARFSHIVTKLFFLFFNLKFDSIASY